MRVDLAPDSAEFIQQRVDNGRYADANAGMREALRRLEEREQRMYLRAARAEARAPFDRGEYVEWSPDVLERLEGESDEAYQRGMSPDPAVCG